ncbi:MAG: NADH-quinone oxidoreductase subunit N [Flavobacteriaceae bacterium]|nr:NADH-quinone oxidoreductase subunit N [Flavobacteriaceae bacterium]
MSVLIIVFLTGVMTLFLGAFQCRQAVKYSGIVGLLLAFGVSFLPEYSFWEAYQNMFCYDENTVIFTRISLLISLLIFLLGDEALYRHRNHQSEIYALVLFSLCGGLVLIGFQSLIILFLGVEILSIPLYILAGSEKTNLRSVEASVKYFLMGAFATGFLLFGFAFVYGSVGSLDLHQIKILSEAQGENLMFVFGVLLVFGAMAFKVAMMPFHIWSPDVYYGSPTWITLFMVSVVKIVGFYGFFKLMSFAFGGSTEIWQPIMFGMLSVTLILASLMGVVQTDVKKMLAYSSIANVGYMGLIFFGINEFSVQNLAFYLLVYALANVGVFMGLIWVEKSEENTSFDAFNGLGKKSPLLAFVVAVSVFSMAGIPFTAGFLGKFNLFLQVIDEAPILVFLAVLASVISVVYYLKLIMAMYFKENEEVSIPKLNWDYRFVSMLVLLFLLVAYYFM